MRKGRSAKELGFVAPEGLVPWGVKFKTGGRGRPRNMPPYLRNLPVSFAGWKATRCGDYIEDVEERAGKRAHNERKRFDALQNHVNVIAQHSATRGAEIIARAAAEKIKQAAAKRNKPNPTDVTLSKMSIRSLRRYIAVFKKAGQLLG